MNKKMKKNKAMRAAGALFVATMLTTSMVSGTYAKYITEGRAADQARVAKFGVQIKAGGDIFKDEYSTDDTTYGGSLTVQSSGDMNGITKVVAPGTEGDGFKFAITGVPEVAVRVDIDVTQAKDIQLPAGSWSDMTTDDNEFFTLSYAYNPVVWTLNKGKTAVVDKKSISEINQYFVDNAKDFEFGPGQNLEDALNEYTLTWSWAFGGDQEINGHTFDAKIVDQADTVLGDLAANEGMVAQKESGYSTEIDAKIKITVTQID